MILVVGAVWGFLLLSAIIVINQNYEVFRAFAGTADGGYLALGLIAAILGSLLVIAVMLLSGILQSLGGRSMPKRWATLFGVGLGGASASLTLRFMPVVL